MFRTGHGRKNYFVIKTSKGYYAAGVAGCDSWSETPETAGHFVTEQGARHWYKLSIQRTKAPGRTVVLPALTEITIEKFKKKTGADCNR